MEETAQKEKWGSRLGFFIIFLILGLLVFLIGGYLAVAIVFTITHAPVKYTPNIYIFLIGLFALALAWGDLMQKTDSIWGSVLFHAGADLVIMIGILETFSSM